MKKKTKTKQTVSCALICVMLFTITSSNLFAQVPEHVKVTEQAKSQENSLPKSKSKKEKLAFIGIGTGLRTINIENKNIYFDNEKVEFGGNNLFALSILFQYHWRSNLVGQLALEGFIGKTYGVVFSASGGYRIMKGNFKFIPLMGIGYGQGTTQLAKYRLGSSAIESSNGYVYVGPYDSNYGRGSGEDITLNIKTGCLNIKPSIQVQLEISRVTILGEVGYNVAIAEGSKISLDGKGYKSDYEYNYSNDAPESLSQNGKLEDFLTDQSSSSSTAKPVKDSPVHYSGLNFQVGIAYNFK